MPRNLKAYPALAAISLLPTLTVKNSVAQIQMASIIAITLLIAGFLIWFGRELHDTKQLALVSILGSLSAALRIPFAVIPSFQPSTFLIICSGYVLGPAAGFLVGTLTAVISNLVLGHGPWTPFQIVGWGLAGALAPAIKRFSGNGSKSWIALTVFGFIWGYVFGAITNLSYWLFFVEPLTLETFLATEVLGLWFDTVHALANAVFLSLLGSRTIKLLNGFAGRFPKVKFD
ncbi:MAG: ECF transporter S component [Candidatus Hecatellaceae archaeon]